MKKQKNYIWLDGELLKGEQVSVAFLNHSLHYGSAVFEGIRCYETANGPSVFRLKEHIKRLFYSAKVMGMKIPYSQKRMIEAVHETIVKNGLTECYIRPIVYYGERMGLSPDGLSVHVAIAVWPWGKYLKNKDIKVQIVDTQRLHPSSGVMDAKVSGHYFNSILAGLEAKKAKADEALLLDHKGNIAEGPGENIFFVKGNTLYTPRPVSILPGITRATIIQLAKDIGYKVVEKDIKPKQIKIYDEAFFVGTAVEVHPIAQINDVRFTSIMPDSVSHQFQSIYMDVVHGKDRKYRSWLSFK